LHHKAAIPTLRNVDRVCFRRRTWELLEVARPGDRASHFVDVFILTLIFLNAAAVVFESVDLLRERYAVWFRSFELFSLVAFTIEYVLRLWSCTTAPQFGSPVAGRLRFVFRPMNVVDFLAFVPFYLPFLHADLRVLRVFRLLRIFRVARLGRYSGSLGSLGQVLQQKKEELLVAALVMLMLVLTASSLMYMVENAAQPEKFPDIPATMWWAVATFTTVGYGDVYPITSAGKLLGSLVSILGIVFALPTEILGAAFVEQRQHQQAEKLCPHCGKNVG
jgi:voltage-gated potassium channel